jgi:hypothetical protein
MKPNPSPPGASTLWIALLTGASTAATLIAACATPFPALAALAAVHMRRRDGIALMLVAWLASQIVGFGLRGFPHGIGTLGWAATLAVAATISVAAGHAALAVCGKRPIAARLAVAYLAAFAAYKAAVLAGSLALGGGASALAPALMAEQFFRNGAILIGLLAAYHGLVAAGMPSARTRLAPA